jgi:hypothetical protein
MSKHCLIFDSIDVGAEKMKKKFMNKDNVNIEIIRIIAIKIMTKFLPSRQTLTQIGPRGPDWYADPMLDND